MVGSGVGDLPAVSVRSKVQFDLWNHTKSKALVKQPTAARALTSNTPPSSTYNHALPLPMPPSPRSPSLYPTNGVIRNATAMPPRHTRYVILFPMRSRNLPKMAIWKKIVMAPAKASDTPISSGESDRPVGGEAWPKIGYSELYEMFESWKIRNVARSRRVSLLKMCLLARSAWC